MRSTKPKQAIPAHDPAIVQKHLDDGATGNPGRAIPDVPLAKHVNLTPFPSQYFQSVDQDANVFHTVVLRVTYDMQKTLPDGSLAYAAEQTALATKDEWSGTVNESSPLWESDYAPYKPKCDVLVVNAVSRPPKAQPAKRWPCGLALKWQQDGQERSWSKQLSVTGPRHFGLLGLSQPEEASEVPITWQHAYGGQIKQPQVDELKPDGSINKAAGSARWDTDERNPVGVGLNKASGQPSPQLEVFNQPYTDALGQSDYPPVCLSAVGKAWLPRRDLAGSYDNAWLKDQWPLPPTDFDDGYWNCAPEDQQMDYLPPGTDMLLVNLHSPSGDGKQSADVTWQGKLPRHQLWAGVVAKSGSDLIWNDRKMNLDTLVVNMAAQKIVATYRFTVSDGASKNVRWQEINTVLTNGPPDQPIRQEEWGLLQ
jgi:hypothetical protein